MSADYDPQVGPDGWDKEAIYDVEIAPLVDQIIAICKREELPMLLSVVYRHSDDTGDGDTKNCTTHTAGPKGETNERFAQCVRLLYANVIQYSALTVTQPEEAQP
jgi:hypothetical protein